MPKQQVQVKRDVLIQALEALEAMNPYPASKEDQRFNAITALRAALEDGDKLSPTEPVAWYLPSPDGDDSIFRDHRTVMACTGNKWEGFEPLYTAPPQRKPVVDPAEYDDAGAAERYNRGLK
jgi:hypothetical protein